MSHRLLGRNSFRLPARGTAVTPDPGLSTTGLSLWFRAGDLTSGRPTLLPDASPAARTIALNVAGGDPGAIYKPNAVNGLPSLHFDYSGSLVSRYETAWDATATDGYLLAVVKAAADPAASGVTAGGFFQAGASGLDCLYPWTLGPIYDDFCRDARINFDPTPALTSWRLIEIKSTASAWDYLIDGAVVHSEGAGTRAWASSAVIGASLTGTAFVGELAELGVYRVVPDAGVITANRAYLAGKYAITV